MAMITMMAITILLTMSTMLGYGEASCVNGVCNDTTATMVSYKTIHMRKTNNNGNMDNKSVVDTHPDIKISYDSDTTVHDRAPVHRGSAHTDSLFGLHFILAAIGSSLVLVTGIVMFFRYPLGCGEEPRPGMSVFGEEEYQTKQSVKETLIVIANPGNTGKMAVTTEVHHCDHHNMSEDGHHTEHTECTSPV